ncbi:MULTISPECIES: hypothetical protein [Acinetobacter]|uniref:hypothetical protein n=1 Tax=Acinetobacter TaxID=469 RepID=UPI0005C48B4B|nr:MULTISPECIES: hypothetical protein [Acinetobacter]
MTSKWETSNSKWNELLVKARDFVDFLDRGDFFSKPYSGAMDVAVINDGNLAIEYMTNDDSAVFPVWQDIKKNGLGLPDGWESFSYVDYHLEKNQSFGALRGDFNGAVEKLIDPRNDIDNLRDSMSGDVQMIFQCYANDFFPLMWKKILEIYLHDGFPCGVSDFSVDKKIVVFSNF